MREGYYELSGLSRTLRLGLVLTSGIFIFFLAPMYISDGEGYVTGTVFPAVDKKNGTVFQYDIISDLDAYENAIVIM